MSELSLESGAKSDVEELAQRLAGALDGRVETAAVGVRQDSSVDLPGYGAQIIFEGADGGDVADVGLRSGVTPLLEYGLLKVHGADAEAFLQAQLTNDVASLGDGAVRLAGYCSVKGRLMASFWVWRDVAQQTFWLACSRDIAAAITRRLSMFVLRSKVKVENVSDTVALLGFVKVAGAGDGLPPEVADGVGQLPLPPVSVPAILAAAIDPARVETAADLSIARALQPVAAAELEPALQRLKANGARLLSTPLWRRLEVLSGIARINSMNQELFVPQMVNFEIVQGVSFRKGCYPGQEVVARSQYLGKLKRRMFLGLGVGAAPLPGTDVEAGVASGAPAGVAADGIGAAKSAEPVGQVVLAAPLGGGERFVVLFESRIAAVPEPGNAAQAPVSIGKSPISLLPLPYPLPASAPAAPDAVAASPRPDAV